MHNKNLVTKLSEEQLDELLTYTPAFSEESLANIKARAMEKINYPHQAPKMSEEYQEEPILRKKSIRRSFGAVAAALIAVMLFATTAFATWHFLRPSDVAEEFGNTALSAAFESDSAININETIAAGDYIFTLLAIVSGTDITDHYIYNANGDIIPDRTYAVLAVQKADGSPMPSPADEAYEPFMISPFVQGLAPWQLNVFTLFGGQNIMVADGIMYTIVDFTDITMFADRGIYLGISSGGLSPSILMDSFSLNENTGEIYTNPQSEHASAIFTLPFDAELADAESAQELLDSMGW